MWQDPIVAEVRQTRKQIEESYGNSFDQLFRAAVEIQKQYKGEVIAAKPGKKLEDLAPVSTEL